MTTDVNNDDQDKTEESGSEVAGAQRERPSILMMFICLFALSAAIVSSIALYISLEFKDQIEDLESSQARLNNQEPLNRMNSSLETLRESNERIDRTFAELKAKQESILASLTSVGNNDRNDSLDWLLAEVEYLLIIASHRLVLEQDVTVALAAMESADDRLKEVNDPRLLPIRRQITSDINALKSVNSSDTAGLALYLADIAGRVDKLPLKRIQGLATENAVVGSGEEEMPEKSWWRRLGDEVLGTLSDHVKVYPEGEGTVISLLPEQRYYLYQNLRLQLEIARLATMRKETQNFHASIDIIEQWLVQYFDTDDASITNIIDSLAQMSKVELKPVLPDINSSLEILRSLIRKMDNENSSTDRTKGSTNQ